MSADTTGLPVNMTLVLIFNVRLGCTKQNRTTVNVVHLFGPSRGCNDGDSGGGVYRVWTHRGGVLPHPS